MQFPTPPTGTGTYTIHNTFPSSLEAPHDSLLPQSPIVNIHNAVRYLYRRQPMGNNKGRPALQQHPAGIRIIKAANQVDNGALSHSGGAHKGKGLFFSTNII